MLLALTHSRPCGTLIADGHHAPHRAIACPLITTAGHSAGNTACVEEMATKLGITADKERRILSASEVDA